MNLIPYLLNGLKNLVVMSSYDNFEILESDFSQKKLHPADLKQAVGESLVKIVSPIREQLALSDQLSDLIKNSY